MTVHCAGRLGILSWIYTQRHIIAFELGLSSERPIAECSTEYISDGLVIVQQDDTSHGMPSAVFQAKEINLFFSFNRVDVSCDFMLLELQHPARLVDKIPPPPIEAIFHPPAIA